MAIKTYKLGDALMALKIARPICQPNSGFMFQLKCFEWVLNLADEPAVFPKIYTGPKYKNYQYDFGLLDLVFDSSLDDKYKHIIVISSYTIPAFRPGFSHHKILPVSLSTNLFHTFDIDKYIETSADPEDNSPENNTVLILGDTEAILEAVYWNLLWRADYKWDDANEYMKSNARELMEHNNFIKFDPPLDILFKVNKAELESKIVSDLDKLDKQYEAFKYKLASDYVYLLGINTYFIKSVIEKKNKLLEKYR
jgi:hypothetical protein